MMPIQSSFFHILSIINLADEMNELSEPVKKARTFEFFPSAFTDLSISFMMFEYS